MGIKRAGILRTYLRGPRPFCFVLFLEVAGIVYLVVIRDKYGIYIVKLVDELHASVIAEQEACGAQGIGGQ